MEKQKNELTFIEVLIGSVYTVVGILLTIAVVLALLMYSIFRRYFMELMSDILMSQNIVNFSRDISLVHVVLVYIGFVMVILSYCILKPMLKYNSLLEETIKEGFLTDKKLNRYNIIGLIFNSLFLVIAVLYFLFYLFSAHDSLNLNRAIFFGILTGLPAVFIYYLAITRKKYIKKLKRENETTIKKGFPRNIKKHTFNVEKSKYLDDNKES